MPGIDPSQWTPLGTLLLVAAAPYLALAFGRLVPAKYAREWREAYMAERDVNAEQATQLAELTEASRTILAVLRSIQSHRPTRQDERT